METIPFYLDSIINDVHLQRTLIDNGNTGYGSASEWLVRKLQLPTLDISPRLIEGIFDGPTEQITKVTYLSLDVGGNKQEQVFLYVVPRQKEGLILGRAWLHDQHAVIDEASKSLTFKLSNITLKELPRRKYEQLSCNAATFAAMALRAEKRPNSRVKIFAASLRDIEKALQVKKPVEPRELLPPHYHQYLKAFDPKEAATLPPHRPGIDHEIPIETDENGKEKEVPWGPLYNMSREELLVLRKTLMELLDKNWIRASKSSAGAPVLFAKKPGGGLRFCVDYRALNAITKKDRYPLPLIRETLRALSKAKWLTKLDVSAAFHRIRVTEGDEWKTAMRTRYGSYEWLVTPFGLTGAPATFQRYINWVLREYLDDFCTAYIDDILIFSEGSLEDHRSKVKKVLAKMEEAGLTLDIKKCNFEVKQVKYLGYIVEAGKGIQMDPEKIKAIQEWEAPTTVKGVRGFLGFANYYRIFIKSYSEIVHPLTMLTKKDCHFTWGQECQKAFEMLKEKFTQDPILTAFDPDRETFIEPDASTWATGGVLSQKDNQGKLHPVAFYSKKNLPAECNYEIHDKELLAVIRCIEEWDAELRSLKDPFTVLTDHKNLETFMKSKRLNERQMRWMGILNHHRFQIKYQPGSKAVLPDALSRRDQDRPTGAEDKRVEYRNQVLLPKKLWAGPARTQESEIISEQPFFQGPFEDNQLSELWKRGVREDKQYQEAWKAVQQEQRRFPVDLKLQVSISECDINDGLLRFRERYWIPSYEPLCTKLIQQTHDSVLGGHPGRDATFSATARQFFWPNQSEQVRRFVKNCDICGSATIWRHKKWGLLKPLPVPNRIWSEISIDFITGLPQTPEGFTACEVITDRLGKGVMYNAVADQTAEATAERFIQNYVRHHGLPKAITSDRGAQWVNAFWKHVCCLVGITRRLSTAYHPETDGSTERHNQEIEHFLRCFICYAQTDWNKLLPIAELCSNNKQAASTGFSPFFLMHGYNVEPIQVKDEHRAEVTDERSPRAKAQEMVDKLKEAQAWAQTAMAAAQQRQEHYANESRQPAERFKPGDKVWLNLKNVRTDRPSKKLDWIHAKYTVLEEIGTHSYKLDVPRGIHNVFHASILRPTTSNPLPSQTQTNTQPPAIIGEGGEEEWAVEEIVGARTHRSQRQALVKWKGWHEPTWEPVSQVQDTAALDEFEKKYGDIQTNNGAYRVRRRREGG